MLEVTERAVDQLAQMRTEAGLGPDRGLGILPQKDRLQLAPVQPGPTDHVIERAGEPIVVVPAAIAEALDGLVLDCQVASGAPEFTLIRPGSGGPDAAARQRSGR